MPFSTVPRAGAGSPAPARFVTVPSAFSSPKSAVFAISVRCTPPVRNPSQMNGIHDPNGALERYVEPPRL
jgi:hypothetical protein